MKQFMGIICGITLAASGFAEPEELTLEQALQLAKVHSPGLQAARLQTLAAEKSVGAAGRWVSPELGFEAENFGGDFDGFDDAEYTVSLSQTFERGGKRKYARAIAEGGIAAAFQAEAELEMELLAEVRHAFIEVLSLQEISAARDTQEDLGRSFLGVARARNEMGAASSLEVIQAELSLDTVLLAKMSCLNDLTVARVRLASLMGVDEASMAQLADPGFYVLDPMGDAVLADSHPMLQRATAEIEIQRARASAARATDAMDVTLGAGYRYIAGVDLNTFVFGASVPLHFARAGRAEQAAIMAGADAMAMERARLKVTYQRELSVLLTSYDNARTEAHFTQETLIPKARQAYKLSREGYEQGVYSWIELIASQQHLAEIRIGYIELLRDAHIARANIARFMKEGI